MTHNDQPDPDYVPDGLFDLLANNNSTPNIGNRNFTPGQEVHTHATTCISQKSNYLETSHGIHNSHFHNIRSWPQNTMLYTKSWVNRCHRYTSMYGKKLWLVDESKQDMKS